VHFPHRQPPDKVLYCVPCIRDCPVLVVFVNVFQVVMIPPWNILARGPPGFELQLPAWVTFRSKTAAVVAYQYQNTWNIRSPPFSPLLSHPSKVLNCFTTLRNCSQNGVCAWKENGDFRLVERFVFMCTTSCCGLVMCPWIIQRLAGYYTESLSAGKHDKRRFNKGASQRRSYT
jgi:hypothetical protein